MKIPVFHDKLLLVTALTHRSALNEHATAAAESNERLEYLGDAVLELITTEFLYQKLPHTPEGKLTAIRSSLVKTTTLSAVGEQLGLSELIYLSRGEEKGGGRTNKALLADTVEAIIGAVYLDQGLEGARKFVHETILTHYHDDKAPESYKDPKSRLQEKVQALGWISPIYQVINETGPDHNKSFTMNVTLGETILGQGQGHNKQAAQQAAATDALERIQNQVVILQRNYPPKPDQNITHNLETSMV